MCSVVIVPVRQTVQIYQFSYKTRESRKVSFLTVVVCAQPKDQLSPALILTANGSDCIVCNVKLTEQMLLQHLLC